jgi:DNA polymerase-3 subunit gamma/tau
MANIFYMTLYLKYRPKNLDELDLISVAESLKKIMSRKAIPHAFLFAGPKGIGKTSAARIVAKMINCEHLVKGKPCDKCKQCTSITEGNNLDVIEMDAASHRGIDDVRVLRDAVGLAPVSAKKKVYIIDEAHMLTTEASNALLKTLEEPPSHVVFILATTNPEKLLETIRSRTTFILFKKATTEEVVRSLKRVATGEKIKIDKETLEVIAEASDGSFRDAIKTLEQLTLEGKKLNKEFLEEFLFSRKTLNLDKFIRLLTRKDTKGLIEEVGQLSIKGVAASIFLEALLKKLRSSLLAKTGIGADEVGEIDKNSLIYLIELFSQAYKDISESPIEELPLEVAVVKWCEGDGGRLPSTHADQNSLPPPTSEKLGRGTDSASSHSPAANDAAKLDSASQNLAQTIDPGVRRQVTVPHEGTEINDEVWKTILSLIKPINASIEALLRAARPVSYNGHTLTLGVFYKFHKERLEDSEHRRVLESIVGEVLKSPTRVICTLVEPPVRKVAEEAKESNVLTEGEDRDIIKVAEEIFGS